MKTQEEMARQSLMTLDIIVIHSAPKLFQRLLNYRWDITLYNYKKRQSASYYRYTTVMEYNLPLLPQQQSVYVDI